MNHPETPIRVLIAEDSLVCRELLVAIFQNSPDFQVIGVARDGAEALRLVKRLRPDVVTMDVHMPEMNGYEATRLIMEEMPCPIIMVTNSFSKDETQLTFDALQAGALSILDKPAIDDPPEIHDSLLAHVRLMSEVRVVRRWPKFTKPGNPSGVTKLSEARRVVKPTTPSQIKYQIIAIAASTGGPGALANILCRLPADFPIPILLVQHVTNGFGEGFAAWLDTQTPLAVRVARYADKPKAGYVLVAPDNQHMIMNEKRLITFSKAPSHHGLCPSADYLFQSMAEVYGDTAVGIILTGMGQDGAEGLKAMYEAGAYTIAQNKETCAVFGMPAVAIELGAVEQIEPPDQIADTLIRLIQRSNYESNSTRYQ